MKAFVVTEPHSYGLTAVPEPALGRDELLLKVGACGICGSDLDIMDGVRPMEVTRYPVILGHEFSGEVREVGPEVVGFKPGDRVAVDTVVRCDECRNCRMGWGCHCLKKFDQLGCTKPGGMAEYVAVPQRLAFRMPDGLSLAEAALAEPASCAAHGVSKANIRPGDSVVITGAGPIGSLALQIARLFSPGKLILVEVDERKLAIAKKLGATHTINAKTEDVAARVLDITEGLGASAVIECTGALEPIQQAFSYIGTKGRIVVVGVPTQRKFEIDFIALLIRDASFTPSNGYTTQIWLWVLDLLRERVLDTQVLITHRMELESIDRGFDILRERSETAIKIMACFQ